MIGLTSNNGYLVTTGSRYSADALARESDGFRAMEARDPETMDFPDLCLYVGLHPFRIRKMVEGLDPTDEIAIDSAIRAGIHKIVPSLDDFAHLFVRHFYRPVQLYAEAAE